MMKKIFTFICFIAAIHTQAQFTNAGLETWVTYSSGSKTGLERPASWYSADSLIFFYGPILSSSATYYPQLLKSGTSHSGTYAAEIMTRKQGSLGNLTGVLANAQPGFNLTKYIMGDTAGAFTYAGGTTVTSRIQSVSAYVKYYPKGADKGEIYVQAVLSGKGAGGADSVVGTGKLDFGAYSSYTRIYANVYYNNPTVVPDKILVLFRSSVGTITDSTTLYVDDINMSTALDVPETEKADVISMYPNPASGAIHLQTSIARQFTCSIYNLSGQKVAEKVFSSNTTLDVSNLPNGIYLTAIADANGINVQHAKLIVAR